MPILVSFPLRHPHLLKKETDPKAKCAFMQTFNSCIFQLSPSLDREVPKRVPTGIYRLRTSPCSHGSSSPKSPALWQYCPRQPITDSRTLAGDENPAGSSPTVVKKKKKKQSKTSTRALNSSRRERTESDDDVQAPVAPTSVLASDKGPIRGQPLRPLQG